MYHTGSADQEVRVQPWYSDPHSVRNPIQERDSEEPRTRISLLAHCREYTWYTTHTVLNGTVSVVDSAGFQYCKKACSTGMYIQIHSHIHCKLSYSTKIVRGTRVLYWNSDCRSSSNMGDAEWLMTSAGSELEFTVFLSNWCALR